SSLRCLVHLSSYVVDFEDVAVNWTRPDLGPDQYVFFYRDGRPDPYYQHPSYRDHVDLVHSQLMGGDLSVVLKNVTTNDSGTFECRLIQELENQTEESRSESKLLSTIVLKVSDPGEFSVSSESDQTSVFFHPKNQNSENPSANKGDQVRPCESRPVFTCLSCFLFPVS
uniref:Ig-like domain-containing protein n=1 Tax=Sphaeramia orbicularis TaxID=375764 RepID=A0A673AGR0_9TELE